VPAVDDRSAAVAFDPGDLGVEAGFGDAVRLGGRRMLGSCAVLAGLVLNAAAGWWWADLAVGTYWSAVPPARSGMSSPAAETACGKIVPARGTLGFVSGLTSMSRGGFMRQQQAGMLAQDELVAHALRLVTASVIFGALSGTVSVIAGLRDGSLGVLAAGLGALADVTGSAVLVWRFRAEQRHPGSPHAREARAAMTRHGGRHRE
jgi:hypothetical protein